MNDPTALTFTSYSIHWSWLWLQVSVWSTDTAHLGAGKQVSAIELEPLALCASSLP